MKANRTWLMTVSVWVIGGTMLMGAGTALADPAPGRGAPGPGRGGPGPGRGGPGPVTAPGRGDDRGRVVQRHEDRGHDRDNYRHDDRDDRGRGGLRVGVTFGRPMASCVTTQRWVEGYYVTQMRNVLVEPAHWEVVTVSAVTERRYPSNGCAYTVVIRPAYAERMWVADRYEARGVRVFVPGHYEMVSVPVGTVTRPVIRIGGIIRF